MLPRCFPIEARQRSARRIVEIKGHFELPKLTQRLIETAKPSGRDAYIWDSEVPGFGLRIKPTGTKSLIVSLRIGGRGGQQRRRLLGNPRLIFKTPLGPS